ncbi:hypothetical protein, partial [Sansalvadorimonas verongulae]|uniref:hypothetical protein n=1 Tax=Sansalvadorimonas verongulae TaxID=2172824 RepID=UPI001E62F491
TSSSQRERITKSMQGICPKAFRDYLADHDITIYWIDPEHQRHKIAHFAKWTGKLEAYGEHTDTLYHSGSVTFQQFTKAIGENHATFSIVISPSKSQSRHPRGYTKLPELEDEAAQSMPKVLQAFQDLHFPIPLPSEPSGKTEP